MKNIPTRREGRAESNSRCIFSITMVVDLFQAILPDELIFYKTADNTYIRSYVWQTYAVEIAASYSHRIIVYCIY